MNKDEKVTQFTEADWLSREIARCKKCDSNMYNCRNSKVQCNFVNIDEYVNDRLQQQLLQMKTCDTSAYKFQEKNKHCKCCKCSKAKKGNSANYIQKRSCYTQTVCKEKLFVTVGCNIDEVPELQAGIAFDEIRSS